MKDLKQLEEKIIDRLNEIRNKENNTLNEKEEFRQLQVKLRKIHSVMIYIKEMKEDKGE